MTPLGQHRDVFVHRKCRACEGDLEEILNLGTHRLNGFPRTRAELQQIPEVPLVLTLCGACGLVQLDRTVPPDWMYRQYWYQSGINESMKDELHHVVTSAVQAVGAYGQGLTHGDVVMDVGANDGTLLRFYEAFRSTVDVTRVAVEPAQNLIPQLTKVANVVLPDYFPSPALTDYAGRVAILTAVAMAYDLEHPVAFFQQIHDLLRPGGIAVIQFQDLLQQIQAAAFDTICHEHLEYYSLWSLGGIVRQAGLRVWDVQRRSVNGGSLRVILRRDADQNLPQTTVRDWLLYEAQVNLDTPTLREGKRGTFQKFARKVDYAKRQIEGLVSQTWGEGRVIDCYGASTKGNVLLQVLGIGPDRVRQALDIHPDKHGRMTLTGIPIVHPDSPEAQTDGRADVWLVPIWQFREHILQTEQAFIQDGGTLVFPLPGCEVVTKTWQARGGLDLDTYMGG